MYGFNYRFVDSDGSVFYYDIVSENDITYRDGICHRVDGLVYTFTQVI